MAIREELQSVGTGIATARNESLTNHPLAHRITHGWRDAVESVVNDPSYKVEGSPGKGNWAETVWLSVFDRTITETAQQGFYVVYLVAIDGSAIYLSADPGDRGRVGEIRSSKNAAHQRAVRVWKDERPDSAIFET